MDVEGVLTASFATGLETVEKREEARIRSLLEENRFDFEAWMELVKHVEGYVRGI
jgi:hypothetical protein